jgi:chloramphenicol-sensitive protein RarD
METHIALTIHGDSLKRQKFNPLAPLTPSCYKEGQGAPGPIGEEKSRVSVPSTRSSRQGLLYGLAAYGCWGIGVPLYFKVLLWMPPLEMVAQRVAWTVLVMAVLLTLTRRWDELKRAVLSPKTLLLLCAGGCLIGTNWLVYIYSVATNRMVQAGLGYFMLPLVSMFFGMLFLGERLRWAQWVAVVLAALGVLNQTMRAESLPWIALVLAGCFGLYGLLRKTAPVDGMIGLSAETLFLLPLAAAWLIHERGASTWSHASWAGDLLVASSGIVTATPLLWFAKAARLLPLTTLGFIQYFSPSLQCLLAVWVFGEPFTTVQLTTFALIWAGLAIFSVDSLRAKRLPQPDDAELVLR